MRQNQDILCTHSKIDELKDPAKLGPTFWLSLGLGFIFRPDLCYVVEDHLYSEYIESVWMKLYLVMVYYAIFHYHIAYGFTCRSTRLKLVTYCYKSRGFSGTLRTMFPLSTTSPYSESWPFPLNSANTFLFVSPNSRWNIPLGAFSKEVVHSHNTSHSVDLDVTRVRLTVPHRSKPHSKLHEQAATPTLRHG